MKYCKKCIQPDTRPGICFDENQVCYACRYEESKKKIDWTIRKNELKSIAEHAKEERRKRNISYDCIIGVSGGKDSTFQAIYAKEQLGLHPLLVNCMPNEITEIGKKNLDNLSSLGFDMISIRTDPIVAKKLARKAFYEMGNIIVASEYCLWASAYIMAEKFNIPLIIQGENAALTLGTAKYQELSGNAFSVVDLDTLRRGDISFLLKDEENVDTSELYLYRIPNIQTMKEKGITAIFLQYYLEEWSQVGNAELAIARGLKGRTDDLHEIGRYRRYTALDTDIVIANQMIKYLKFGFGYATDEACYDIRESRISREEAIKYVIEYDGKCGNRYIEYACNYLDISESDFWNTVDKFVNQKLFEKNSIGKWIPKFRVGIDFEE